MLEKTSVHKVLIVGWEPASEIKEGRELPCSEIQLYK